MHRHLAVWLSALIFFAGVTCAFAEGKQCHGLDKKKGKFENVEQRVQKLTKQLKLTPEQQAKVKDILVKSKGELKAVMEECRVKMKDMRVKSHDEINALLTPQQQEKFQECRKKQECAMGMKDKDKE